MKVKPNGKSPAACHAAQRLMTLCIAASRGRILTLPQWRRTAALRAAVLAILRAAAHRTAVRWSRRAAPSHEPVGQLALAAERSSGTLRAMLTLEYVAELLEQNRSAAGARVKEFSIGGREFGFNSQPAIMGVINLSPDSWYRESVCLTTESAVRRAGVLQAQGTQLIDVGAESTLSQAARVEEAAQNNRLLPVVKALRQAGI